jgi:hypothetical protein
MLKKELNHIAINYKFTKPNIYNIVDTCLYIYESKYFTFFGIFEEDPEIERDETGFRN